MESSEVTGYVGLSLKERKEEFVSNLSGSSMLEIAALSALVPIFLILRQLLDRIIPPSKGNSVNDSSRQQAQNCYRRDGKRYVITLVKDTIFVGVPTLVCLTILADWVYIVTAVSVCLALFGIASLWRLKWKGLDRSSQELNQNSSSRNPSLSSFRFAMMLVTCVTILAVDFKVFPRRYAKTETYGTGLMDVGVGSFVVANGLVSRQARDLPASKYGGVLRNTSPLFVLGFFRLILTKGVDYQEHVTEYGVHWNFFFTLAAVALLTSLVHIPASYSGILGLIILGGYQTILSSGLNEYLLSPVRGPSLISLNKEGIFTIFGYWSMYLISVQLGRYLIFPSETIFQRKDDDNVTKLRTTWRRTEPGSWTVAMDVWLLDAILWFLAGFGDIYIERISRRLCNLPYVTFVFAMNLQIIAIFLTADLVLPSKQMLLLRIFDSNLLPTFLWGNILTGLVNVAVDTISASGSMAMVILLGYLAILIGGMAVMEFFGLHLKVW